MKEYLCRPITDAIKGVALILMFVHHFFTFPGWYVQGISYPGLTAFAELFCEPSKICVPVFAFLTGFFYFFCQKKTLRYSFFKISDVLITYWAVYFPFLCFAIYLGCYQFDFADVLYEMIALKRPIMSFCWYVNFYCSAMILLPLLTGNPVKNWFFDAFFLLLLPIVVCTFLRKACSDPLINQLYENISTWFPCVAAGYLFAKYNLFDVFDGCSDHLDKRWRIILYCSLVCLAAMGRKYSGFFPIGYIKVKGEFCKLFLNG